MADVRPLNALHYDLARVWSLDDVAAPPYDVIDAEQRAELLARSPFNVVEIDLPPWRPGGGDPYEHAAETIEAWRSTGVLVADREPAIWALTQDYTGPDGERRTPPRLPRPGPGRGLRRRPVRPHERTQPGPKEDRLDLTRATRAQPLPDLRARTRRRLALVEPALGERAVGRGHRRGHASTASGGSPTPPIHAAVSGRLADAELLIADGHHRYETARAYRTRSAARAPHHYTLMCLVALDDPGLTVFPTHRLLSGFAADAERRALGEACASASRSRRSPTTELDPRGEEGVGVFGLSTPPQARPSACGSRTRRRARRARSPASPRPTAASTPRSSRTLVLKGALGMSEDDIARQARARLREERSTTRGAARGRRLRRRLLPPPDPGRAGARGRRRRARRCRRSRPTSSPRS